jgi:hypothetical protein
LNKRAAHSHLSTRTRSTVQRTIRAPAAGN